MSLQAEKEAQKPRKLNDSNFFLGVYDKTRVGGDTKGQLWIAKFPSKNDDNNTDAREKVVHDLVELWKRIVFNMAVSNTDVYLRNHAFILKKNSRTLSTLYDINPVPYGDELSLNVNEDDNRIPILLAIGTAYRFNIDEEDAKKWQTKLSKQFKTTGKNRP